MKFGGTVQKNHSQIYVFTIKHHGCNILKFSKSISAFQLVKEQSKTIKGNLLSHGINYWFMQTYLIFCRTHEYEIWPKINQWNILAAFISNLYQICELEVDFEYLTLISLYILSRIFNKNMRVTLLLN